MEVIGNALQTVDVHQNVIFPSTAVPGGNTILHREGSGLVTLRGITNQCRARFRVTFGANIAVPTGGTVGPISLAISLNGEPVVETTMISTPAAVEQFNSISRSLFLDVPSGCCTQIAVQNISTEPIEVQNASLIIERVA